MAKVQSEIVSGVGKNAKRRDLGNVAKIQRSAKIQNASSGSYGERSQLQSIAGGAAMPTTGSAVSFNAGSARMGEVASMQKTPVTNAFAQGSSRPLTDGAGGNTDGRGPEALNLGVTSPDEGRALAVALFTLYPNPQTRALVEAYDQEGIY